MIMDYNETKLYLNLMQNLTNITTTSDVNISKLFDYVEPIYESELEGSYSVPMFTIGLYIAAASMWCVLSMLADLVHGFRTNKLWFPNTWFTINALSLAVIAVAMKLPVDLSGSMPGAVDQVAKLGSMAFMCIMMANFLPSLATMNSKALKANVMALGVLVITLVINVCIQINTGVIVKYGKEIDRPLEPLSSRKNGPGDLWRVANRTLHLLEMAQEDKINIIGSINYTRVATIYVILLLVLLIIHVSSSLAIIKSKEIIERKYQQGHETASNEVQQSKTGNFLTIEKLRKHVSNYWIMARSGSPQFMSSCSLTTTASGAICFYIFLLHALTTRYVISNNVKLNFGSDYKSSTLVIFILQSMGVIVGTVAPLLRCFVPTSLNYFKGISDRGLHVFKVEKYWTQKLYDWKSGGISLPFRSHKLKVVIKFLKNGFLNLCIVLQTGVVLVWRIVAWSMVVYIIIALMIIKFMYSSRGTRAANVEQRKYILQLENEDDLADRTLKDFEKSLDRLLRKSEKMQPKNLMKLITEKSTNGFQGVRKYDHNDPNDCWSLPVVTLTTIAVALPNIEEAEVKSLLKSVREGLLYVTLVEETLNATDASIQDASARLWEEVDLRRKWLGIRLKDIASQVNKTTSQVDTTLQVVKLLLEEAKNKINKGVGSEDDETEFMSICANSMSGVTETIISDMESSKRLFDELSSRIADIMAACLTNLPQVIAMKCHTSVIEKREASVEAAARLLGETKQIFIALQGPLQDKWLAYLSMTTEDLPFIKKWGAHLSEP